MGNTFSALFCAVVVLMTDVTQVRANGIDAGRSGYLTVWHAYRGDEERALLRVLDRFETDTGVDVEALAIPYEVLASKITNAIPRRHGPDVFIFAHERIGDWVQGNLILALDDDASLSLLTKMVPETRTAVTFESIPRGMPLAMKSLALFVQKELVPILPTTMEGLLREAERLKLEGVTPIAYPTDKIYFHAPWWHAFGGVILDDKTGTTEFDTAAFRDSLTFVGSLVRRGLLLEEPTSAVVTTLFREKKIGFVLSGPWFLSEIDASTNVDVVPIPPFADGRIPKPLLGVEAAFVSSTTTSPELAKRLVQALASPEAARIRRDEGRQVVATLLDDGHETLPLLRPFFSQAERSVAMSTHPAMRNVYEPGDLALKKIMRGASVDDAVDAASRRYRAISLPALEKKSPAPTLLILCFGGLALFYFLIRTVRREVRLFGLRESVIANLWVAPAMLAATVLVFFPFVVGVGLAFFEHRDGVYSFVGAENFIAILFSSHFRFYEPMSFYYTFAVTILWTVCNVSLHVVIGLALALVLDTKGIRLRGIYRILLILPWATPNYITALIWKGLFHTQFGAINKILDAVGVGGISWFATFEAAFAANLVTNVWLGFPFMMVVSLGALQSIPADLYEAADVDGATSWQKFRLITLPLLKPALLPAILLGTIWTFNQFNIVYLVSGGEPDNATDILISEAWRWAFARREQYGYAAAYGVLIFVMLLFWSVFSTRMTRVAERS